MKYREYIKNIRKRPIPEEKVDEVCVKCLHEFDADDLVDIHIKDLGYGSNFDGSDFHIRLCPMCYLESQENNKDIWKLKIVENEHQEKSYEYDEEILKFINNLPVEGKELVLNRFASGYDDYYDDPQLYIDGETGVCVIKNRKLKYTRPNKYYRAERLRRTKSKIKQRENKIKENYYVTFRNNRHYNNKWINEVKNTKGFYFENGSTISAYLGCRCHRKTNNRKSSQIYRHHGAYGKGNDYKLHDIKQLQRISDYTERNKRRVIKINSIK